MNLHHLDYWQQKAANLKIENRLFIDGQYVNAIEEERFLVESPIQGELTQVSLGKQKDIDRAVNAARLAFHRGNWSRAPKQQRKAVLLRLAALIEEHQEEFAVLETLDTGKPIAHSLQDDIPGAIQAIRWYAEAIDKIYDEIAPTDEQILALVQNEPVGVVGAITPWNFPLLLVCWKIGPALAVGNSVVIKPSEKSPLTAIKLAGLAKQAGLPDGVLNIVPGFGHDAGVALARHHDVDTLTFTGSTRVGRQLMIDAGQSNMKKIWIEAGGKSANIVFADCLDLEKTAQSAAAAVFYNQGQVCIAGTRLLLEESIKQPFLQALREAAKNFIPTHPLDPHSRMGTLIDQGQCNKVRQDIERACVQGAEIFLDGLWQGGDQLQLSTVIGPTILTEVTPEMTIWHEEVFGPVLAVTTFTSEEEAIALANHSYYGLGAGVWTSQLNKAHRVAKALRAGTVFVNNYNGGDMTVPFGGYKQSGNGRDKSLHALNKFTELKTTWISLE